MTDYKIGSLLRGILNDLKRRPEDAAKDLDIAEADVYAYLNDELAFPSCLISKACEVWPVSPREFAVVIDDAPLGVKYMSAEASRSTSRVMDRKGKPYYEYRDTAASALSSFRPEWIKELLLVDSNDPEHTDVQWNNGHFMHQFTYFIGPVNFYYLDDSGRKKVAVMNTGDSMYIRPFVPHTFSTRASDGGGGLILALTYGGTLLGDTQQELKAVASPLIEGYAIDYSKRTASIAGFIKFYLNCLSMTLEELQRRTDIDLSVLQEVVAAKVNVTYDELENIAEALNVSVRDLLVYDKNIDSTVVVKGVDVEPWALNTNAGDYLIQELASTPHMPQYKSLKISIDQLNCYDYGLSFGLHQYLYNVGDSDITLCWTLQGDDHQLTLSPGDSAFVKPFVCHCFNANRGELISLRIPSKMSGDAIRELSCFGEEYVGRVADEKMPWFDKRGMQ